MVDARKFDRLEISSAEALWDWLDRNHAQGISIWLVTWKAARRDRYVSRDQVLDALVAYGWIDGIRRKLDDDRTMQMISPRAQKIWADTYKARAARLIETGRMRAPGYASIDAAKASGLWDALADVDALDVPDDLQVALEDGASWFSAAAPSYRRNVLRWIATAKKPETRAKRVHAVSAAAQAGQKVPNY
ncbi:MAG: YdeI/OmpD-associated family protein [Pseudomonadota bacterium]